MTTTEFHNALLQGRGKCVHAVRGDPEKYREEVLWACRELVSFDTQCEGSKGWFIHEMVGCYEDPAPFVAAACEALKGCPSDGSWHVHCLAELLEWFFQDGHLEAWRALTAKYRQLYHQMLRMGPPEDRCYWAERDDYERLCVILSWCREHYLEIARDIGRLSLETTWLKDFDFDWLYAAKGERYSRSLRREAQTDAYLAEYLRVHEAAEQEFQARMAARPRRRLPWKCADPEALHAAMERYLAAEDPQERAGALDAFYWTAYPGDPGPVIRDAQSEHEQLRHFAWMALEQMRHPAVRAFALEQFDADEDAFGAFLANYEDRDEARLMEKLRSETVDFECTTCWHGYQGDVLRMKKPPRAALRYIYDTTYCSCCRADALRLMGKRRMLTEEILQECLYDSNHDVRSYARRALKRRNQQHGQPIQP